LGGKFGIPFLFEAKWFHRVETTQNPSFGLERLRSVLEGNWQFILVIYIYILYMALKEVNRKYKHAF